MIVGDSNMSETTMLLKVGATDLVLRMVEAGVVMRDLTLENPIRAIRDVSHDMTGRRRVRLANGREASALDIQREYLSKARDFVDRRGADATTERVLDLWERALQAVDISAAATSFLADGCADGVTLLLEDGHRLAAGNRRGGDSGAGVLHVAGARKDHVPGDSDSGNGGHRSGQRRQQKAIMTGRSSASGATPPVL